MSSCCRWTFEGRRRATEHQAALLEQWLYIGRAPVESLEQRRRFLGATARQHLGAQEVPVLAFQSAVSMHKAFGVSSQSIAPQIGVVASGVAPEKMWLKYQL